jgi:hypothetical protein
MCFSGFTDLIDGIILNMKFEDGLVGFVSGLDC